MTLTSRIFALMLATAALSVTACAESKTNSSAQTTSDLSTNTSTPLNAEKRSAQNQGKANMSQGPKVTISTSMGNIVLALDEEKAPQSVENFLQYVRDGHYDGTIFHRVINNFMVQGGGFSTDYQQKPTRTPVENEADNGLKNDNYTVAMARTSAPHSATSQFFINVKNNDFLNFRAKNQSGWGYAVFGEVIEGKEVVDAIKGVTTGSGGPFPTDAPQTMVIIEKATVVSAMEAQ